MKRNRFSSGRDTNNESLESIQKKLKKLKEKEEAILLKGKNAEADYKFKQKLIDSEIKSKNKYIGIRKKA